jgi:hypothetical protein
MKALSITRPWPKLIIRCGKRVENRTWTTHHRGLLLLHAAQSWEPTALTLAAQAQWNLGEDLGVDRLSRRDADHPTGIVAVAELVDVCGVTVGTDQGTCPQCGPWAFAGQYHWRLDQVRPLPEPIPCRGALGLWTPDPTVVEQVTAQLASASPRERRS